MLGEILVQMWYQSMENIDSAENLTPTDMTPEYSNCMDFTPPFMGDRHNGLASEPTYTKEINNLRSKFSKCLDIVSRLSFFMLGTDLVQFWCRYGTKAWKQLTL